MLSLKINNPIVENFYKNECKGDDNKFINSIIEYIENYKIKQSVQQGLQEVKQQINGQLEKKELKNIIDEI
jgi:hypothetical protein